MKKSRIQIIAGLVSVVLVLTIVLYVNTLLSFEDTQLQVESPLPKAPLNEDAAVSRFAKAIQFETISYDDPSRLNPEAFLGLHEHIRASFPLVHQQAEHYTINQYSLVYHIKGSNPALKPALFMGHMDVVPVDEGTAEQWKQAPFSGAIVDDVVWGRGTIDDKVTVMALLEAMETRLREGFSPQRSIYFAFGHDEEIGGKQGAAKIAEHFEQQGLSFEFVLDEGGAITDGLMKGVEQPVAMVGVAEKGFVNLRLTVASEGGHSSQPPDHTAAGVLSQAIVNIENSQFDTNLSYSYNTFSHVAAYAPLSLQLPMANLWLFSPIVEQSMLSAPSSAAGIRTTIAATMLEGSSKSNILPTIASAVVNVRILPGDSIASVKQHIVEAIDDSRVSVETFMENEPSQLSPLNSTGYKLIESNIRRMDDNVLVAPYLVMGGTDAKHFYGLSDNVYRFMMVRLNKESLKRFHGVNEQLAVNDYLQAVSYFYSLLADAGE
jgi:carboxypeptidase PM20D1